MNAAKNLDFDTLFEGSFAEERTSQPATDTQLSTYWKLLEFYNHAHDAQGRFSPVEGDQNPPTAPLQAEKRNFTIGKALNKELDAQGVDKMNPIRGVINYPGNRIVIARNAEGKIQGALSYAKSSTGIALEHIRVNADTKKAGLGTQMMIAAAKDALTIRGKQNQIMNAHGTVQDAVPFHQKLGAVFNRECRGEDCSWNSYGTYSPEATAALAKGHPLEDNRIDVNDNSKFDPIYGYPKDHNPFAGPGYDQELKYYLEHKGK